MPTFQLPADAYKPVPGEVSFTVEKAHLDTFNVSILGLGDLGKKSIEREALAAIFDLSSFTDFCNNPNQHHNLPKFLKRFLPWLIHQIKTGCVDSEYETHTTVNYKLPFFLKFTGDGMLSLWDATEMDFITSTNILGNLGFICEKYVNEFLNDVRGIGVVPPRLNCGISRGRVFSVGNGEDYVGSCINIASRLTKLPGLFVATLADGLYPDSDGYTKLFQEEFVLKFTSVKGIHQDVEVLILKAHFTTLSDELKLHYTDTPRGVSSSSYIADN